MRRRVAIVRPTSGVWSGNETTARRWAGLLTALGCEVELCDSEAVPDCELLVALHAVKSAACVRAFKARHPGRPVVLALTGTDLYPSLSARALRTLSVVDRLIVLQPLAKKGLTAAFRRRTRVILQSAAAPRGTVAPCTRTFDVGVAAHLRAVKDPLRAAMAVRNLPASSRLRVLHVGAPLDERLAERARAESVRNPRYRWLGERRPGAMHSFIRSCRLLVVTSVREGGPNVISEALAAGVPVVASRIDGNIGLLGRNYPGLVPPRDAKALREVLLRAESEPGFLGRLQRECAKLAPRFAPERERMAWSRLLAELGL